MKNLSQHITESFQVNESLEDDVKVDDIITYHYNGGSVITTVSKVNKTTIQVTGSQGLYNLKKSEISEIVDKNDVEKYVKKNYHSYVNESFNSGEAEDSVLSSIRKEQNDGCSEKELINMGRSENIDKDDIKKAIKTLMSSNKIYKKNDGSYHLEK